jgi:hypothetical protein
MRVDRIGYGAGQKDFQIPNVLRVSVGELGDGWEAGRRTVWPTGVGGAWLPATVGQTQRPPEHEHTHETREPHGHEHEQPRAGQEDVVVQLETNVDDMNPEWYGHVAERLFTRGALDVTLAPVYMKKGRPGTIISVLVTPDVVEPALATLFAETTTLGVRMNYLLRRKLDRQVEAVETPFGRVRVKLAIQGGAVRGATPEYEDCRALAVERDVALSQVYEAAQAAARELVAGQERGSRISVQGATEPEPHPL